MISEKAIEKFQASTRGPLLRPADEGYEDARRIFNAMIDRRPAFIARCATAGDVISCVRFAREHKLPVSVRGGGHNVAGNAVCDAGLVIDLSRMKGIRVDPKARSVRAEPGLTLGEFDRETQAFGLATTLGAVSMTGIAGLTLGGGLGWLMAKHGLACDNVLSMDIVTADGELLTCSAEQNQDLYWGLRGGGGNFGVVTSFEYQLHPLGPVLGGLVGYPVTQARNVLRFYREFTANSPDELVLDAGIVTLPDGNTLIGLPGVYSGGVDRGEKVLQPLRSFGSPAADLFRAMPYTEAQSSLFDWAFPGRRYHYWKSSFLRELSDGAIDIIADFGARKPSPYSLIVIDNLHGAAQRVPAGDTAFSHRDAPYSFLILGSWASPAEEDANLRWVREFWAAMQPFMRAAVYVNYMSDGEGEERVRAAYGGNYARLAALKQRYDPENTFRMNQNVKPSDAGLAARSA